MNALMTSATLQREVGIETIPHVTPRDTTVMGLEGVLLGAHAEASATSSR
jgi:5,10-methylenetetrahydrofolate reductase